MKPLKGLTLVGVLLLSLIAVPPLLAKDLAPYNFDRFFDPARLVRIDLRIATNDWDALRVQERSLIKTMRTDLPPAERDKFFDEFRAELAIDGTPVGPVSVRKKGFVGSLTKERPSLKIKLNRYDKKKRFAGLEMLTLNNNRQDPSRLNQVIGYGLFRKARLPASRCNLAVVTVNGQSLGIYSNVESVDGEFLRHRYPKDRGTLWEGTVADFNSEDLARFERKFGPSEATNQLAAVVAALEGPDSKVLDALAKVIDVDAFLRFWAMEVLIGHWDGYASNRNNYFLYFNGLTRRLVFVPWGADQLAEEKNFFWGDPSFVPPKSVKAASVLPRRLYGLTEGRERYFATMRSVLKEVWNEEELGNQFASLKNLIKDEKPRPEDHDTQRHASLEAFIKTRRADIEKEMKQPYPEWALKPFETVGHIFKVGVVDLEFSITQKNAGAGSGKLEDTSGTARLQLTMKEKPILFDSPTFRIGSEKMPWGGTKWTILISRPPVAPDEPAAVEVTFYAGNPNDGPITSQLRVDAFASPAQTRILEPATDGKPPQGLALAAGQLNLTRFDPVNSGEIKGHLTGELFTSDKGNKKN